MAVQRVFPTVCLSAAGGGGNMNDVSLLTFFFFFFSRFVSFASVCVTFSSLVVAFCFYFRSAEFRFVYKLRS